MRSQIETITQGKSKAARIYTELLADLNYNSPHQFVSDAYTKYQGIGKQSPSVNGLVFEYIICEVLAQSGVKPFYFQAEFLRVPNAIFDIVLYDPKTPIILSMKVSLRERYKQAALEGAALLQVYRNAKNYLISLDDKSAVDNVNAKIDDGEVYGLDRCILANATGFTDFVNKLRKCEFQVAEKEMPIIAKKKMKFIA